MRPNEIHTAIETCAMIQKNVVLLGPPGVGKTVSVQNYAKLLATRLGVPLVDASLFTSYTEFLEKCPGGECVLFVYLNINTMLPVDIAGIPDKHMSNGTVYTIYTPNVVWAACKKARRCVVFIDEFNTTENPDMLAMIMRLLGECRAGMVSLACGEKTIVIAAGNPPEMNAIARPVPAPLLGGKACVLNIEPPTVKEWIEYMHRKHRNKWNSEVAGFLTENPAFFVAKRIEPDANEPYPTPRGWEAVALIQRERLDEELVASLVGWEAARAFIAWRKAAPTSLAEIASEESTELLYVKLLGFAARGQLCKSLEYDEAKILGRIIDRLDADAITIVSYVAAPWCPESMFRFWGLVPEEKKRTALVGRLALAEITSTATSDEEVLEELL